MIDRNRKLLQVLYKMCTHSSVVSNLWLLTGIYVDLRSSAASFQDEPPPLADPEVSAPCLPHVSALSGMLQPLYGTAAGPPYARKGPRGGGIASPLTDDRFPKLAAGAMPHHGQSAFRP